MPTLAESLNTDISGYSPVSNTGGSSKPYADNDLQPGLNSMLRCPLPPIFGANPDSLRQFYQGGAVPQTRLLSPANQANTGGGASGGNVVSSVIISTSPPPPAPPTNTLPTAQGAVLTTPQLNPGDRYTGQLSIAKGFLLLTAATDNPARVTLYGSSTAQSLDASRGIDVPPAAGVVQGIITDLVLDTTPLQWSFQDRVGSNSDSPQNPTAYITVTNIGSSSTAITVTVLYVPLES